MSQEKKTAKKQAKQAGASAAADVIYNGGTKEEAQQAASEAEKVALKDSGLFKNKKINKLVDKWEDKSGEINQTVVGTDSTTMEYGSVGTQTGYHVGKWQETRTTYNINTNTETLYASGTVVIDSNNFGGGAVTNLKRAQDGIFAFRDSTSKEWETYEYKNMVSIYNHDLRNNRTFNFSQKGIESHYYVGAQNRFFNSSDIVERDYTNKSINYKISGNVDKSGFLKANKAMDNNQKMDLADLKVGQLIESAFGTQMFNQNFVVSDKGVKVKNNYIYDQQTKKSTYTANISKKKTTGNSSFSKNIKKEINDDIIDSLKEKLKQLKNIKDNVTGKMKEKVKETISNITKAIEEQKAGQANSMKKAKDAIKTADSLIKDLGNDIIEKSQKALSDLMALGDKAAKKKKSEEFLKDVNTVLMSLKTVAMNATGKTKEKLKDVIDNLEKTLNEKKGNLTKNSQLFSDAFNKATSLIKNIGDNLYTKVKLFNGDVVTMAYKTEQRNGETVYLYGENEYSSLDELEEDVKEELEYTVQSQSRGKDPYSDYKPGEKIETYNGYNIIADEDRRWI